MHERTKTVTVRGAQYQLRRMTPEVGSYLYLRIIGTLMSNKMQEAAEAPQEDRPKPSPEETARMLCGLAFVRGFTFEEIQFAQRQAMMVTSLMEDIAGTITPMPLMSDSGQWSRADIKEQPALVQELTLEAMVFNLSGFFG